MKYYNVIIDERDVFDQSVKFGLRTKIKFQKIQPIMVIIIQLVVYWIIIISKTTIR